MDSMATLQECETSLMEFGKITSGCGRWMLKKRSKLSPDYNRAKLKLR
jgi:hypothetical protein